MDAPDDNRRERLIPPGTERPAPKRPQRKAPRRRGAVARFLRGFLGTLLAVGMVAAAAALVVVWTTYRRYAADLPTLDGLRTYQPPMMSRVYAGDDQLLAELATERRIFVPFTAIPELVQRAFISAEDQSFYTHKGVDPLAIARAALTDLQHMGENRRPVGASTITQQVARNMLLGSNAVSLERKVKEALLAMRLEQTLSKQRILELYLNEIYLGQGSYGVAAAAQTYFSKPLDQLDVAEAATLAALPKSPSNYNPFRFPEAARARRNWVIDRMVETRSITPEQAQAARAEPLVAAGFRRPELAPGGEWFALEVRRRLLERFGQDQATEGGLIVHTSFDPALQAHAEKALHAGLMAYDRSHGGWRGPVAHIQGPVAPNWAQTLATVPRPPGMLPEWRLALVLSATSSQARLGWLEAAPGQPESRVAALTLGDCLWARPVRANGDLGPAPRRITEVVQPGDVVMIEVAPPPPRGTRGERVQLRQIPKVQGALVAMDPNSGRVLAMSGGWSAEMSQFNRATQAQRQPGSSFKPFVYLTAMEQGISPSEKFLDAPFVQGDWRPNNYEMTFGGPTPLHVALEKSLNLVTVRVAQRVGMDAVARTAIAFHEVESMPKVLPAALGAVDTTVLREAGAYASLAMGGREVVPTLIDSVQDRDGHVIWRDPGLALGGADPKQPPAIMDARRQIADPESTAQVLLMLEGVVQNGTGVPVVRGLNRPIAGKTGTSQDYNDAWFAGFTPDLVTVVWVGYDTPQTLGDDQTGAVVAGPIWHDFMAAALKDRPRLDFRIPDGVTLYRWSAGSHDVVDAFKPGQEPGGSSGTEVSDGSVQMIDPLTGEPVAGQGSGSGGVPGAPAKPASTGTGVDSGMGGLY